jgi:hypothetical protein
MKDHLILSHFGTQGSLPEDQHQVDRWV